MFFSSYQFVLTKTIQLVRVYILNIVYRYEIFDYRLLPLKKKSEICNELISKTNINKY